MSEYTPTTEEVRAEFVTNKALRMPTTWRGADEFDRWLAAHDAEVRAAERERIIQDMQKRSHPDDWGVPCVYVESYAEHLRGEKR